MSSTVLCAERGEKLSGELYSVVCRERGEIELWAIKCCVLREGEIDWGVIQWCARKHWRNSAVGDRVLCAEGGEKLRGGR